MVIKFYQKIICSMQIILQEYLMKEKVLEEKILENRSENNSEIVEENIENSEIKIKR